MSDDELNDVDVVALGCWSKRMMPVMPYLGSITGQCAICDTDIWIGERQQAVAREYDEAGKEIQTLCLECSAQLQAARQVTGAARGDVHRVIPLGGETTVAGRARIDQLGKEMGVDIP